MWAVFYHNSAAVKRFAQETWAGESGKSICQTVQLITAPTLGLVQEEKNPYLAFCGILPKEGTDELRKSLESQRTIDPEFWK